MFKNSRILTVARYGEAGPGPNGSVMTVDFELDGRVFTALNGGPLFQFTEAISFVVRCATQQDVDEFWEDAERKQRVMRAMLQMKSLDIAGLEAAYALR